MATWKAGWSFRKSHVITHATGAGTDYQVQIKVHYGNGTDSGSDVYLNKQCKTDFGDIVFTGSDGSTTLNYWIESKTDGDNAVFWVKVTYDLSSTDRTIYLYYGNSDVSTASNFDGTFIFGDPFDNATLNADRWPTKDGNPQFSINEAQHYLEVTNMDGNNWWNGKGFHSRTGISFPAQYVVEYAYGPVGAGTGIGIKGDVTNEIYGAIFTIGNGPWSLSNYGIAFFRITDSWMATANYEEDAGVGGNIDWSSTFAGNVGTFYGPMLKIWKLSGNINVEVDQTVRVNEANSATPDRVHLGIAQYMTYGFGTVRFYAFRIRKYVSPEPAHGAWGPIELAMNACYSGFGSKQNPTVTSSADTVIKVEPNVPTYDWDKTAVIENLVIDGQNRSGVAGILLKDVYNCWVRNVTIQYCDVGIRIDASSGNWTQANRLEHIRMIGVKTGILVTGADNGTNQGFTIIDDVGIALKNDSSAIGIQIGNPTTGKIMKPYSSFIKANVWFNEGGAGGTGMQVYGELKYSLVNLEVENLSNPAVGTGVYIQTPYDKAVYYNQGSTFDVNDDVINKGFLLTCGHLTTWVNPGGYNAHNDINQQGWP
jgi:hypothetical protein